MLSRSVLRASTSVLRPTPALSTSSRRGFATLYTAKAHTTGGRTGESASDDGKLKIRLSTPKEMGGPGGDGTNPEQVPSPSPCPPSSFPPHPPPTPLTCPPPPPSPPVQLFASGYSACFLGAMGVAAKNLKLQLPKDAAIDAKVQLNKDGQDLGLQVTFDVKGSGDKAQLKKIVEEAHKICPYSRATRNNVHVQLNVV